MQSRVVHPSADLFPCTVVLGMLLSTSPHMSRQLPSLTPSMVTLCLHSSPPKSARSVFIIMKPSSRIEFGQVCWARVQGLEANVDHYRNSPVNEMPHNEYKPMLFARGQYIPFPMPPLPYAASGHPVEFPRPLSATDNSNQKLVVHQTPQHTGG